MSKPRRWAAGSKGANRQLFGTGGFSLSEVELQHRRSVMPDDDKDDPDFYYVRVRRSDERFQLQVFGYMYVIGFAALFTTATLKFLGAFD
jgi:hypothetical protein